MFRPTSLPPTDAVEVVLVRGLEVNRADEYMVRAREVGAPRVSVVGPMATKITELFRALPIGEGMRCHMPTFGLRFFASGRLVAEVSLCWSCNNGYGWAGAERIDLVFDAASGTASELRAAMEQAVRNSQAR